MKALRRTCHDFFQKSNVVLSCINGREFLATELQS